MKSLLRLFFSTLIVFSLASSGSAQSFQRTVYNSPNLPSDIFVSDLNNNGKLDVLTNQINLEGLTAFLNQGNGTFLNGGAHVPVGGFSVIRVVAADFNHDGIPDIAGSFCSSGGFSLDVQFGKGNGTFDFANKRDYDIAFPNPPFVSSCLDALGLITVAGDTVPSLVASTFDQQITIFRNNGAGIFSSQQMITGTAGMRYSGVSTGDYNGDGFQDIAAIEIDPDGVTRRVVIFYQLGNGTFNQPASIFSSDDGLQFTHTVDLNGDTKGDLLVSFSGGPSKLAGVVAFNNLGAGNFRSTVLTADPLYAIAGVKPASIHPVGKLPGLRGIILPLSPDPSVGDSVFALFPAVGTGWGAPIYFDDPGGSAAKPDAVANGDFNADGRPDFAAVDENNHMLIFLNTTTANTCAYPTGVAVRICSPASGSTQNSLTANIHASATAGALPITAMKAYIDGKQVAASGMNTLDASVTTTAGTHTLTINAWDPTGAVHQSSARFITH
jgi:FG-GAP-like repeat